MKQLLFLLLFPCLCVAQYTGNGNQKITLGEQTTADGLVFRGVASIDTVTATSKITRANKQDTSAFLLLDTVTNLLWHYKTASNGWIQAGGGVSVSSFSAGTTGLTPSTATTGAVTLGGTLAVANGGTGNTSLDAADIVTKSGTQTIGGAKTFSSSVTVTGNNSLLFQGAGATTGYQYAALSNTGGSLLWGVAGSNGAFWGSNNAGANFSTIGTTNATNFLIATNNTGVLTVKSNGNVGIGTTNPEEVLHVVGNGKFTVVGSGAYGNVLNITSDGTLTTGVSSDINFKYNINPISYGLETILKLKPVSYQWINGDEYDLGFIAQDAVNVIPEAVDTFHDSSLLFRHNTIIPILTKAIQEQQALIKALEQRLLILENK